MKHYILFKKRGHHYSFFIYRKRWILPDKFMCYCNVGVNAIKKCEELENEYKKTS